MSTFILSIDENDDVLQVNEKDVSFSCFIDHNDGFEIKASIPLEMWSAYNSPSTILVQVIP